MIHIDVASFGQSADASATFTESSRQEQVVTASPFPDRWIYDFQTNTVTDMFSYDESSADFDQDLEQDFTSLAEQWRRETRHISSIHDRSMNRAYQRIIALGRRVVPLILCDLEVTRDHWLWALDIIQDVNPAEHAQDFDEAVDLWLSWGRQQGYLS